MRKFDWRRRLRRLQFTFRHKSFTLVGDEGRPYRRALALGGGFLLVLLLLLLSREEPQLMSSPEILAIQDRATLRVGVRNDVPGLNGPEGGLEQALAEALAARVLPDADPDSRLELIEVNTMTMGAKLDDGSVDAVIAMAAAPMAAKYYYSDPYYQDPCLLITLANAPAFQLQNMEIGVVQSNSVRNNPELSLVESYLVTHPSLGLRTRTYASYPDMLEALARGEIRAAAMVESCIGLYQEEYGVVSVDFSFGTVDYAICSPSDASALASVGSLLLQDLEESGGLQSLYQANGLDVSHMPSEEAA